MSAAAGPRGHRDPELLAGKRARLTEPHVHPLTRWTRSVQERTGLEVPHVDPESGGVHARALLLLEAPGPRSTARGSGIVSADNDDGTAENFWRLASEAGLPRDRLLIWNIVPWYIGTATRIRSATAADVADAQPYLHELLALLPDLRLVVAVGVPARDGWLRYLLRDDARLLPTLACPHPSPRSLNARPQVRAEIVQALRRVRDLSG